jgi:hypothetical protein
MCIQLLDADSERENEWAVEVEPGFDEAACPIEAIEVDATTMDAGTVPTDLDVERVLAQKVSQRSIKPLVKPAIVT